MSAPNIDLHGSPAGYEDGCRTPAQCPHHRDPEWLTCAEAVIRRRGDRQLSRLPMTQPLARHPLAAKAAPAAPVQVERADAPQTTDAAARRSRQARHGTMWQYRQGCQDDRSCPHWTAGRVTCAEARRRYVAKWRADRLAGIGTAFDHGTSNGYLMGCTDGRTCPTGVDGLTCSEARSRYRERLARAAGIAPRAETMSAADAARRVRAWVAQGRSIREIAHLTGCGRTTIAELAADDERRRRRVTPRTMTLILAASA
jgi:hypothetical protein